MIALRCTLALFVATVAVCAGSLVLADGLRVLLIGPSSSHPTVVRVRDELRMLGLGVDVMTQGTDRPDLAALARERGAAAAARVEDWPPEIVVWVDPARHAGEPTESAEIRIGESLDGPIDPGLLALRAIELLRGKLIQVPAAPQAGDPRAVDAASPAIDARDVEDAGALDAAPELPGGPAARASTSRRPIAETQPARPEKTASDGFLSAFVAGAILLDPGGVPAVPQVRLGGRFMPSPRFGLEVMSFLPAAAAIVSAPEGAIELRTFVLGGGPVMRLTEPTASLSATAGLGLGGMLLLFKGDAEPPFLQAEGSRWAALPYVGVGVSYSLHPLFALRADAIAALALPEPVLRVAARQVASVGRPAVFFSLGIEVRP